MSPCPKCGEEIDEETLSVEAFELSGKIMCLDCAIEAEEEDDESLDANTPKEEIIRVAEQLSAMELYGAAQLIYRLARERDGALLALKDGLRDPH